MMRLLLAAGGACAEVRNAAFSVTGTKWIILDSITTVFKSINYIH